VSSLTTNTFKSCGYYFGIYYSSCVLVEYICYYWKHY